MKRFFLMCVALLGLWGCSSVNIDDYRAETPVLELRDYFDGTIDAWGMFQDRSGKVIKRFHVQIDSRREGDKLILDERFVYSDGERQRRVWTLTPDGPGRWRGTAGDVIGEARGELAGNALRWQYRLLLPVDDTTYEVEFDDWMYLMDERVMLNKAEMSKFGIRLGEVTLSFTKP